MVNALRRARDSRYHSISCMVDVKKAFDSVSPHILCIKLRHYGFDDRFCDLVFSFMTDRSQFVDVGSTFSRPQTIHRGVPQGSLLGPLLFLIFFNDLCSLPFFSNVNIFADDTSLYISGQDREILVQKLNADLYTLDSWMRYNYLSINANKSEIIYFRPSKSLPDLPAGKIQIGCSPIPIRSSIRFLGVLIDDDLSGSAYFSWLRRKLVGGVAAITRARHYLSEKSLLLIYHAFLSAYMSYGIEAFGFNFKRHWHPILILQKRALRLISHSKPDAHTAPLFVRFNLLPYPLLVRQALCLLIFKMLTGRYPCILPLKTSCERTRGSKSRLLLLDRSRSCLGYFNICTSGAVVWNGLPVNIRGFDGSFIVFRRLLSNYLSNQIGTYLTL